nr:hypothetical protein [Rhodococcus sp. (in: high G+C Gram-positive bacteria)]
MILIIAVEMILMVATGSLAIYSAARFQRTGHIEDARKWAATMALVVLVTIACLFYNTSL